LKISKFTQFANIGTTRRKYKSGDFHIDLDITDFGYKIGEIELIVENQEQVPEAQNKIRKFAEQCGLITGGIRGKVLEYIFVNNPKHYSALLASGLVGEKLAQQSGTQNH